MGGVLRSRVVNVVVTAAVVAGACTPSPSAPAKVPAGPGGTTSTAPTTRQLLTRDIDHPSAPDCTHDRYNAPDPSTLPAEYLTDLANYRYTSQRDPNRAWSAHQLCGQLGPAVDQAWGLTHGSRDVLIAELDSGIKWRDRSAMADLAEKIRINTGELPLPRVAGGATATDYDANGDGHVSIADYAHDDRVTDRNANQLLDPEDLLLTPGFVDGVDADHNGYVDDIAGWDFLYDDNDPFDDVDYGHGTGEARDSAAAANGTGDVGTCPECTVMPVRVSDSFVADGGRFAAAVLFGLDSGADIIQEALGAVNNPSQAQQAIDAAYRRGVPVVASMADEASKHPNLPAAMNHTIAVNSITQTLPSLGSLDRLANDDTLALNGCTNYGGITWVAVPSASCSSEATGLGAGMVGLVESAARAAHVAVHPSLTASPGANVLSANEVAQLLRGTADDVDFATPHRNEPANEARGDLAERYPTSPGWDATFGFGRVNTYEAVKAAASGEIPPEADVTGPAWFEVLPVTGTVAITGSVAAVRSAHYDYRVEWTTGLQPPPSPGDDVWHPLTSVTGRTQPVSGTLATLDLAAVAAALPDGGRGASATDGRPDEDRFAVRLRVVVTDAEGRVGVAQHQVFVHDDPQLVAGFPRRVAGVGAPSPVFTDLDGRPGDELVVGTDDGDVHAYTASGGEAPGFPVRTGVASWWHSASPTAIADHIPPAHDAIGIGGAVIADLDGDRHPEVAVTDGGGHLDVWSSTGTLRFRAATNAAYSSQSATDELNRVKPGFIASPAAADLDGDGDLELIAAALDRHVYAWHADGTPVAGFPVLLVDPAKATAVEPVTHHVTFGGDDAQQGGGLVTTPAIGDIDGDGHPDIVVGAEEEYDEGIDVFPPIGLPGVSGNTRLYAIQHDGTAHPRTGGDPAPAHPADQAYLPGWPVKLPMIKTAVLPTIGEGVNSQAAIGDVNGDGSPDVVAASSAGPVMVLDGRGRSVYGGPLGLQLAPDWIGQPFGAYATSHDGGLVAAAFGGPALGDLWGGAAKELATPTVGIGRAADQLLAGHQRGDTQLMAWDGTTGHPLDGFPQVTSDLALFVTPAMADVDGDGRNEVLATNGVSLLDGIDATGKAAAGYPKLTGGWSVGTPGLGDLDGDGRAELAVTRRDGVLLVWHTAAPTTSLTEWPRFGHDDANTGNSLTPTR